MKAVLVDQHGRHREIDFEREVGAVVQLDARGAVLRVFRYVGNPSTVHPIFVECEVATVEELSFESEEPIERGVARERREAVENAVGELCNPDAHFASERVPTARRLSEAFGLPWPPFVLDEDEEGDESSNAEGVT